MVTNDHAGQKKIQCWIKHDLWDKMESLNIPNQTFAVTQALELLVSESQNIPKESQDIPKLRATIEGLQLLLQAKDETIQVLKKENERLDFYAQYFKSVEHRRLEQPAEEIKAEVQDRTEKPARTSGEAYTGLQYEPTKERPDLEIQEVREKTTESQGKARPAKKDKIKKICANCNKPFLTENTRKVHCSDACKSAYYRKNKKAGN